MYHSVATLTAKAADRLGFNPFTTLFMLVVTVSATITLLLKLSTKKPSKNVFILDFSCHKARATQMVSRKFTLQGFKIYSKMTDETQVFMSKLIDKSGIGDSTYSPESLLQEPPNICLEEARKESEDVMFESVEQVLAKTHVHPKDIGIVVVNCSLFNPVPSLADMIVSRFKLRGDVICYNLSGMGCSAGISAIGLAKQLLQVHHNVYALVVTTENITENVYGGDNLSMALVNCLFRVGGAAVLLSNRTSDRHTAKYQLMHTVHTHNARFDRSYNCIHQQEDESGMVGVGITKDLMVVAIKAIEANIMALCRVVLPVSEQIFFLINYTMRCLHVPKTKPYVPHLSSAFDHFFPHVGGKPVLDDLQNNLGFSDEQMEASRMTLYRFGNTSSSSIWYELAYAEAKGRIKKGDRVWQISFGAGFKCCSAVYKVMKTVGFDENNPWTEEIDEFPVDDVSKIGKILPYFFEPSKKSSA